MSGSRPAATVCIWAAAGGALLLALAPLAYRTGIVGVLPALALTAAGLLAATAAFLVAPVVWVLSRTDRAVGRRTGTAFLVALVVLVIPVWTMVTNAGAPPIHQISTDLEDPPSFEAVIPLRGESANPLDMPGRELIQAQRAAYPDVRPLDVGLPPAAAWEASLQVATELGWEIVAATDPTDEQLERRIEATETTSWFGFKDDVVIRVRPTGSGSRVDLRSISRVGVGDLGANANRIRRFIGRLESTLRQD